ncbi:hypothetical protein A2483_05005 [Candidatus Peregrinibacteria bacterium RIFOXYC2_FULL_33_13]|nr:MAG: hypothetical protein UR27_C0009G0039 [Candidatus Peregrinibacteria bacterium GW2011_GWA2_33_10]KKP41304.1 MAG: hypothetical protein UR30_C0001G0151 [Candidatus Peregrinibacteria bacterium GW2011_GWC2_33_13]OGJ46587.1 MAG: hypothetical protein A2229_00610 [Candidatus Peregrinibacteria bacterium RIFOXYA2_FULL_33_7]OGJ52840.1 MAG: hypothetical protein A2483_05005 [Candidatus Peregrinibacteria bacterium RIFOXYC2_FULL_33_13]
MIIYLKKFGTNLISRPSGKEAYLALQPLIKDIKDKENLIIDFKEVLVLTPSWADEFITPLQSTFKKRLDLKNTGNPSVKATLETLKKSKAAT